MDCELLKSIVVYRPRVFARSGKKRYMSGSEAEDELVWPMQLRENEERRMIVPFLNKCN